MFVQMIVEGDLDGDALSDSICKFLGLFNSVPQFIANDDWQIEIMENDEEEDDTPLGWIVDCSPAEHVQWGEVARVVEAVNKAVREHGASGTTVRLVSEEPSEA